MRRMGLVTALFASACVKPVPVSVPSAPAERIVFFGDSLVHRSERDHGLISALQARLARRFPQRRLELLDKGKNGDRISDLRDRMEEDVVLLRPALVVLLWDSDCSDVDEQAKSAGEVARLRADYEHDLEDVLARLRRAGAEVLVAGPALIGEQPRGANARDGQLDAYAEINRRVALEQGARYVDTRGTLQVWLQRHAEQARDARLMVTEDGEHFNARGTALVARHLLTELERWLGHASGTPPQPTQDE